MLAFLTLLALAPPEGAPARKVGVAPIVVEGKVGKDVRRAFDARLDERLDATDVVRSDLDEQGCGELACLQSQAETAGADVLLRVTVVQEQRDYTIRSEIVATGSGEVLRKDENYCEICTYDEALETFTQQIDNLREPLQEAITAESMTGAPLVVTSRPGAAVVRLDGEVVGATPFEGSVAPGAHEVGVSLEGYRGRSKAVAVGEDMAPVNLDFQLKPAGRVTVKQAAGWGLVGVAVPMVVSGIALMAIDENPHRPSCSGDSKDVNGTCEFRYNTLGAGVGLFVGGLLVAGGGTALILLDRKDKGLLGGKKRASLRATPYVGVGSLGVRGQF